MSRRVVVVGAGVAGAAAAWSALRAGARVTVVRGRAGAGALGSGAVDDVAWDAPEALLPPTPLGDASRAFVDALGCWAVGAARVEVATLAGILRPARGRDRSLLDLGMLAGLVVAVPRCDRAGWDAAALARGLGAERIAVERGLRFAEVDAPVAKLVDEHEIGDLDLAARHDDPARVAWLAERLEGSPAVAGAGAVLLGPWLGLEPGAADELSRRLGKPVGETTSGVGGAAGVRLERACARLIAGAAARIEDGRAARVAPGAAGVEVALEDGTRLDGDAVVLAVGGVAGGGIVLAAGHPPTFGEMAERAVPPFALALEAPVVLASAGRIVEPASSASGAPGEALAWSASRGPSALEGVGVWTDRGGRARGADHAPLPWLFAAGDAVADRPRTLLEAVRSGLRAGEGAARG